MSLVSLRIEHVSARTVPTLSSAWPDELPGVLVQFLLPIAEILEAVQQVANMDAHDAIAQISMHEIKDAPLDGVHHGSPPGVLQHS